MVVRNLSLDELNSGLSEIRRSPKNYGVLEAIVIRPAENKRVSLQQCQVSSDLGIHGDNWADGCWLALPDGRPHPDVQVAIMNARAIALIAQAKDRWPLAGDNLYVDLDISDENLQSGQKLAIGSSVFEITDVPHNGCKKFAERFGKDAVKFVNSPDGKLFHLRGIYAKVIQAGSISVGDRIQKL